MRETRTHSKKRTFLSACVDTPSPDDEDRVAIDDDDEEEEEATVRSDSLCLLTFSSFVFFFLAIMRARSASVSVSSGFRGTTASSPISFPHYTIGVDNYDDMINNLDISCLWLVE